VAHSEDLDLVAEGHVIRSFVARKADAVMDGRFFYVS
jgi:hypothetical protein